MSTLIFIISMLVTLIFSVAILRHLDTRQKMKGKAYDTYDITLQLIAMFAPFATMVTVCMILS